MRYTWGGTPATAAKNIVVTCDSERKVSGFAPSAGLLFNVQLSIQSLVAAPREKSKSLVIILSPRREHAMEILRGRATYKISEAVTRFRFVASGLIS